MPFRIIAKDTLPKRPNTVDANVLSNLQQGTQAGLILNETSLSIVEANQLSTHIPSTTKALRIISPVFLTTLGGLYGETAASQSLSKLYNSVVGSAYDSTSFNRADLGKHLILSESFILAVDMIDRYLDSFSCTEFGNLGADQLVRAQLFSKTNTDFMNLQAVRNLFVPLIDKLLIPSHIPWLNRHRSLVRHIYVDDIHDKTCFIVPIPYLLYDTLMPSFNVSSSKWYYANGANSQYNILQFAQNALALLTNYVNSAFLADISPYLWRAMCQENGPHIDVPISISERHDPVPNLNLDVIFDYNVIQMIRNATYVGGFLNEQGSTQSPADMEIEENNDGVLVQGRVTIATNVVLRNLIIRPLAIIYATGVSPSTGTLPDDVTAPTLRNNTGSKFKSFIYPGNMDNKYFNLEDYPSKSEAIYYALNATANIGDVDNGAVFSLMGVANCGDTLFIKMLLIYSDKSNDPNSIQIKAYLPYRFYNMNHLTTNIAYTAGVIAENGTAVLNSMEDVLFLTQGLVCCPPITNVYSLQDESLEMKINYIDKDNMVAVSRRAAIRCHEYIMFSAFDISKDEKFDDQQKFRGSNKGKKHKSKGKQQRGDSNPKPDDKGKDPKSGDK